MFTARVDRAARQARPRLEPLLQRAADPRREGDRRALASPTRVFFCNSGAEANEGALKLARRYQAVVAGAPQRTTIVSTHGSFHGRSIATVSITGQPKYREGFGPLFGPVEFIAYGDLDAADARARRRAPRARSSSSRSRPRAASSSRRPATSRGCGELCDETGTLLIFDEVQTGVGRTGTWFGHQHDGVDARRHDARQGPRRRHADRRDRRAPRRRRGASRPQPGGAVPHASTFGGNPLACAAAVAVLDIIETEGLLERVDAGGPVPRAAARRARRRVPGPRDRGRAAAACCAASRSPAAPRRSSRGAARRACCSRSPATTSCGSRRRTSSSAQQLDEAVAILRGVLAEGVGRRP